MNCRPADTKGQTLLAALGIMLVLLLIVPAMVMMVVNEGRWTIKNKKSTTAYYLAEAGIDRGYWKVLENQDYWALLASDTIAGYDFDQAYSDVPSTGTASLGTYCIKLSSYSLFGTPVATNQRVITASGRDNAAKEIRTIELLLEKPPGVSGAIHAQKIGFSGGGRVHWGPMISLQDITLSGAAVVRYPRKYAKLKIQPQPPFDENAAAPNYDTDSPNPHTEFWSYNEPPGVPNPPPVDLPYYKNLALYSTAAVAAGYGGGQYYSNTGNFSNLKDTQTWVRYTENDFKFTGGTLVRGVVIAINTVEFSGGPANKGTDACPGGAPSTVNRTYCDAGLSPFYPRTVNIPAGAWQEYQKIDTAAAGEYPGDQGGPGSPGLNATYIFGAASDTNLQTQSTLSCNECFIYAGNDFKATGGSTFAGAVLAPNNAGLGSGGAIIYYQDTLNIKMTGGSAMYRKPWRQVIPYWPGGLP